MGDLMQVILEIGFGLVVSLMGFILKSYNSRLSHIERQLDKVMTEDQVRLLLNDKLEPLKDRMTIIELKLDKLIDLMLRDGK